MISNNIMLLCIGVFNLASLHQHLHRLGNPTFQSSQVGVVNNSWSLNDTSPTLYPYHFFSLLSFLVGFLRLINKCKELPRPYMKCRLVKLQIRLCLVVVEPFLVTKEMDLDCLHYVSSDFYSWYRTK